MVVTNSEFCSQHLLRLIEMQSGEAPLTKELEKALQVGPGYGTAWYSSQREHWLRWLQDYQTAGPYGRKPTKRTPAKVVYGRVNCPPMVFWLAEIFGVDVNRLSAAHVAAAAARKNQASQSGAIRSLIPWDVVFASMMSNLRYRQDLPTKAPKMDWLPQPGCNDLW
ncbi:MAG: hypothetical protein AAFZ99_13720 [Pseudomonadota bacterium]